MENLQNDDKEIRKLKRKISKEFNIEETEQRMIQLKKMYDPNCFSYRLFNIMKMNKIKKVDLARAIGVSEQTARNWFDTKNGYRPQWVDYMFNIFIYLIAKDETFNPIHLFSVKYSRSNILNKYKRKKERLEREEFLETKNMSDFYKNFYFNNKALSYLIQYKKLKSLSYIERTNYKNSKLMEELKKNILDEITKCL